MKLATEFIRLPVRFDVARLRDEIAAFDESDWRKHPSGYRGNSAIPLITVNGTDNDEVGGPMLPTRHLERCPYIRQILAHFAVVWGRSRLMRLGPGAVVPEHSDINYHWFNRVRIHIPITTRPEVLFHCGGRTVHMGAGEAWIFDNWRQHRVENPTSEYRVHLVADTTGTSRFWQLAARGHTQDFELALPALPEVLAFDSQAKARLITERFNTARVMPPSEIDNLVGDLRRDLSVAADTPDDRRALARFHSLMDALCQEWRSLWSVYADESDGWPEYTRLRDHVRAEVEAIARPIYMRSNGVLARNVLSARVLNHALSLPGAQASAEREYLDSRAAQQARPAPAASAAKETFDRPIIIVAAPRSGSTLLFETLACSSQLWTVGGETHTLIEALPELRPGAPGVDSNRLTAVQATPGAAWHIRSGLLAELRDAQGRPYEPGASIRFLEKTPKNALRIPFLRALLPDALFVLLWRDPRQNISSIMEAWRSGHWVTYPTLDGWDGPWSLLLPDGWRALRGRPLEEVAAAQWEATNRTILDDLAALPSDQRLALSYQDLVDGPAAQIARICTFAGLEFDAALRERTARALPLSKYTQSEPSADKWRANEAAIERVLPKVESTWSRLREL